MSVVVVVVVVAVVVLCCCVVVVDVVEVVVMVVHTFPASQGLAKLGPWLICGGLANMFW